MTTFTSVRCIRCRWSADFDRTNIIRECPNGHRLQVHTVSGTVKENIKCGGSCLTALGPDCECSCGGEHHGRYAA